MNDLILKITYTDKSVRISHPSTAFIRGAEISVLDKCVGIAMDTGKPSSVELSHNGKDIVHKTFNFEPTQKPDPIVDETKVKKELRKKHKHDKMELIFRSSDYLLFKK